MYPVAGSAFLSTAVNQAAVAAGQATRPLGSCRRISPRVGRRTPNLLLWDGTQDHFTTWEEPGNLGREIRLRYGPCLEMTLAGYTMVGRATYLVYMACSVHATQPRDTNLTVTAVDPLPISLRLSSLCNQDLGWNQVRVWACTMYT